MFSVKRLGGSSSCNIQIRESRPGEGREPRHYLRRAIFILKSKSASRDPETATLKAFALMDISASAKVALGRWSVLGGYDPLPDFLELLELATARLAPFANKCLPVSLFLGAINAYVGGLVTLTPAQRMSA